MFHEAAFLTRGAFQAGAEEGLAFGVWGLGLGVRGLGFRV